jgi:hypothetical protein
VKPAVTEVVLIERRTRSCGEKLVQRTVLLGHVGRFFAPLCREPLQGLGYLAVNRTQTREGIAGGKPVQMHILPPKRHLQDLMCLPQRHRTIQLRQTPNPGFAIDQPHADPHNRVRTDRHLGYRVFHTNILSTPPVRKTTPSSLRRGPNLMKDQLSAFAIPGNAGEKHALVPDVLFHLT